MDDIEKLYHFLAWEYVARNPRFIKARDSHVYWCKRYNDEWGYLIDKYKPNVDSARTGSMCFMVGTGIDFGEFSKLILIFEDMNSMYQLGGSPNFTDYNEERFYWEMESFLQSLIDFHVMFGYCTATRADKANIDDVISQFPIIPDVMPSARGIFSKAGAQAFTLTGSFSPTKHSRQVELDLDLPITTLVSIIKNLKKWHEHCKAINDESLDYESDEMKRIISSIPVNRPGVGLDFSSHGQRLAGLWLWDRVQELNGKRGAINQAIEELDKIGHLHRLNIEVGDEDLRFWRRRTDECIQAAEVLPFTKRKKGTQSTE